MTGFYVRTTLALNGLSKGSKNFSSKTPGEFSLQNHQNWFTNAEYSQE